MSKSNKEGERGEEEEENKKRTDKAHNSPALRPECPKTASNTTGKGSSQNPTLHMTSNELELYFSEALAWIGLWEVCWIRPFSLERALITELCLRYRLEACSIPLRCGEPLLSIPPGMSTSYASDCKELLGIPFEKVRGRHDSEIHLGKLRWEFTGVPHCAKRMMGGRAPQDSVSVGRRPSRKGKAPVA
ncbi:hypothetical protein AMTR_s00082p00164090 [Amborella trichopoda]|uniref:Uncharacterized protein n=1 Tax=Amborella trichopoda TaxID=13333 RepID=W1NSL3_AMBTC|nr:hypothetical protein AMTR_s00082p00164090 [Amborella trichopoda]